MKLHRLALSDASGEGEFFVYSEVNDPTALIAGSMNSSLVQQRQFGLVAGQYSCSITVERSTVDIVCAQEGIETLDLIKIDTEGHEREVLDGAKETLTRRGVRLVFLEYETVLPIPNAVGGALASAAELLEPLGFKLVASYPNFMVDEPLYASFNALFLSSGETR